MILCCGEALIDMIPEATGSGAQGFVPHNGGAVFNTAIALGRLGARAGMFTGLSTDMFGQQLRAGLEASGVDAAHVVTSDRPTTLAFVHLTDGFAKYSFFDENTAGRLLTPADAPPLPRDVEALFFGGISLAAEPGAETYAALCAREGKGRAVMIDPNIRPGFIENEARYRARLAGMICDADIIKVSDEDLDWLRPEAGTPEEKAQGLLIQGPSLVILTRGADGATAFLKQGHSVHVPSGTARVVDTVGAGDTFNAGVLAKLRDLDLLTKEAIATLSPQAAEQVLSFGAQVAAITVSRAGANPPWLAEMQAGV